MIARVKEIYGAPVIIKFGSRHPYPRLDLRTPRALIELNADAPVDAVVVQTHSCANERCAASEPDLEWPPENPPAPDQDAKSTLNGHSVRTVVEVEV